MIYNIRGKQMAITDAIRDFVEKKLDRLEKYIAIPDAEVTVTMSVTKNKHTVEVTIPLPGLTLRAEDSSDDMYASIDLVVEKLERQIRKHKTRINRKSRATGIRTLFTEEVATASVAAVPTDDEVEIVKRKTFSMKPMEVDEAILQMEMVGHNFFVFNNAANQEVNVVYRRNDGQYGLIEQA
jgi:putative sigma-54 modulation protein